MWEFVTNLKDSQKNVPIDQQVQAYFELLVCINDAKKENDMDKVFMFSQMSLGHIDALITDTKKYTGNFDIVEIPALDEGFMIALVRGLKGQMQNFKEVVAYYDELKPWKEKFEQVEKLLKVVEYIKNRKICIEKDLYDILDFDPFLISYCIMYLKACKLIDVEKVRGDLRLVWK